MLVTQYFIVRPKSNTLLALIKSLAELDSALPCLLVALAAGSSWKHSRGQSPVFFVVVALERLQPLEKRRLEAVEGIISFSQKIKNIAGVMRENLNQ